MLGTEGHAGNLGACWELRGMLGTEGHAGNCGACWELWVMLGTCNSCLVLKLPIVPFQHYSKCHGMQVGRGRCRFEGALFV